MEGYISFKEPCYNKWTINYYVCSYAIIYQLYSCSFNETLMGGLLQLDSEPSFMIIFLLISHLDSNIVIKHQITRWCC